MTFAIRQIGHINSHNSRDAEMESIPSGQKSVEREP